MIKMKEVPRNKAKEKSDVQLGKMDPDLFAILL